MAENGGGRKKDREKKDKRKQGRKCKKRENREKEKNKKKGEYKGGKFSRLLLLMILFVTVYLNHSRCRQTRPEYAV